MEDAVTGYGRKWTAQKLGLLTRKQIMDIWSDLPAPDFSEMDGEYEARLLDQGSLFNNWFSNRFLSLPLLHGAWLGKCFTPSETGESHGYNAFFINGRVKRKYRMKTYIAPSRFDGKDAFQLFYSAYDNLCAMVNMVDEVRKLSDDLYIGVGTWGFTEKQRHIPLPFYLTGPVGPFVGPDRDET